MTMAPRQGLVLGRNTHISCIMTNGSRRGALLRLYRDSRKAQRCVASRLGDRECSSIYGRCHSISRRAALDPLAHDGHLWALNRNLDSLFRTSGSLEVTPIGVHRASTFHGLCSAHDSRLFRRIDTTTETIDLEAAVLHFYRATCHEMYLKDWSIDVNRRLQEMFGQNSLSKPMTLGSAWAAMMLMEYLVRCEEAILTNNYNDFAYSAFISPAPLFLVSSSVWFPDRDFHGRQLQKLPQADHLAGCVGLFAIPHEVGSQVLVVWHRDSQWCADMLFHSLATAFAPEDIGAALIRMILTTSENVFFRPTWWTSKSADEKALFLAVWQDKAVMTSPVDPLYLRALDGVSVEFDVTEVDASTATK